MRNLFNVFFGLIFTISGVIIGFWANSHHPDNINFQKAIFDKDFWVFKSVEFYYMFMGFACFVSGVGVIGLIQHLVSQSKSENQIDTPRKSLESAILISIVTVFCIIICLIALITTIGHKIPDQPNSQKTPVPVVITLRDSLFGEGMVAIFSNQTPNNLRITVTLENKEKQQTKSGYLDIEPNGKREIGWVEGWKFLNGETITVSHPEYSSFTKIVSR
jgi:hypothetical protein